MESSDLDVRGGLLQSMMMLFTSMGAPRFKKTSQLHWECTVPFPVAPRCLEAIPLYPGCRMWIFSAENHDAFEKWTHGHILILEECLASCFVFALKECATDEKNIFSGHKEGGQSNQLILVVLSLVVFVPSLRIFALWTYLLLYSFYKSAVL